MRKLSLLIILCCFALTAVLVPADAEQAAILSTQGMLMLVNRGNRISKTYEPEDLVLPRVETRKASLQENIYLRREAAQALERMFETARLEEGYVLYAVSGYRSYGIQQLLFNAKVEEVGSGE
ncbi:MAG TPA: D-alanyl-D-alanine carboxypeptidase family protein, partial [Clostridia bacterium]|nr:D-alanyl-D-alanine carboxypeptidase family protein [Clostridia bacterium]